MSTGKRAGGTITPCVCLLTHDTGGATTHDTGVVRNIGKLNIGKDTLSLGWA